MKKLIQKAEDALRFAGQAKIFFFLLIWLMLLLVLGTVSQKYIGLYAAQKLYFSTFVIWLGGLVPVPGGYTIMALIFINLIAKLASENWTRAKAGTLVIHCGVVLLLIGGFLTAAYSQEGAMVIREGITSNFIEDYHRHELVVTDTAGRVDAEYAVFNNELLKPGNFLRHPSMPFAVTVEKIFPNFTIVPRTSLSEDGPVHGMLVANEMHPLPRSPEDDKNLTGAIVRVTGVSKDIDGLYGIFDSMPIIQHIRIGKKKYRMELRRERTALPFTITLVKFDKQMYPGTDKAKSYQSEVILKDGAVEWRGLIEMNTPLRYKGYTFFQASFAEDEFGKATILAVVKNIGAIFPYISSIIICLGLLIHLVLRIPKLRVKVA